MNEQSAATHPLQYKITWWLLSIMAAGFLSWSFALMKAINSADIIAEKMLAIEEEQDKHHDRPWHSEAGHMIRLQQKSIEQVEAQQLQILEILRKENAQ